jgi:acetoin utilization deacetylase AcuC-like enzyme
MTTGYFTHKDCVRHEMGPGHPECPGRLMAIDDRLIAIGIADLLEHRDAPEAQLDDLMRAHSSAHVLDLQVRHQHLQRDLLVDGPRYSHLDPDTAMNEHTWQAALRSAGGLIEAVDAVMRGELENAFCATRPPGHHACRDHAMGFCFFNNVAIAALHALDVHHLKRVAIVDFDVHHGNGTEDILKGDDRVLMVSFYQHPFYPYRDTQPAASNMLNVPVPAYTRGQAVRDLIEDQWLPRLNAFKPELILISAGFDAHREDDMGQMGLTEQDYIWITQKIKEVADAHAQGRIVSALEGGYNLDAMSRSVAAHIKVLADL